MLHSNYRILKTGVLLALSALLLFAPLSSAFAATTPGIAGQPGKDCALAGVTPGNSVSAPGSAFNPDGVSGGVYAGQQPQNSVNPLSVSQYDVACFQLSIH